MIKYFHELTEEEFNKIVNEGINGKKITWGELPQYYPQPPWCEYPDATEGIMGCWSLTSFWVKNEEYCHHCECCKGVVEKPCPKCQKNPDKPKRKNCSLCKGWHWFEYDMEEWKRQNEQKSTLVTGKLFF